MVKRLHISKLSQRPADSEPLARGPKVWFKKIKIKNPQFEVSNDPLSTLLPWPHHWYTILLHPFTCASPSDLLWTTTCEQKWHGHCANFKPRPLRSLPCSFALALLCLHHWYRESSCGGFRIPAEWLYVEENHPGGPNRPTYLQQEAELTQLSWTHVSKSSRTNSVESQTHDK